MAALWGPASSTRLVQLALPPLWHAALMLGPHCSMARTGRMSYTSPVTTRAQHHSFHSNSSQPAQPGAMAPPHQLPADVAGGVGGAHVLSGAVANNAVPASPWKRPRPSAFDQQLQAAHALAQQVHSAPPVPLPALTLPAHAASDFTGADLGVALKSVCKVFATAASPNYATPWQQHQQTKSTASGFIVAPLSARRILTNAHAVANAIQVQLRKHGSAKKYNAKVLAVGHECDIAMLGVDDEEFWQGNVEALELGKLPAMQESVSVVGYPTGGDNVCVTKGVVSRVDRQQYSHGRTSLLALQIDAAINSGNSGGPVLKGNKLIGIAFQCLTSGESIGYVIPTPVVEHFLTDLSRHDGRYTGFCDLGACWQTLESSDHKAALGMPSDTTGVYVTAVEPCYHAAQVIRPGDVITHFNGHAIADDGTFSFQPSALHANPLHPQTAALQPAASGHAGGAAVGGGGGGAQLALPPGGEAIRVGGGAGSQVTTPLQSPKAHGLHTQALQVLSASSDALALARPSALGPVPPHALVPAPGPAPPPATIPLSPTSQQVTRIDFRHLVAMNFTGDSCQLGIWRDGAALPGGVQVRLSNPKQLVPVHSHDQKPHYFIYGGLVFTKLTNFYLRATYGTDWTHKAPIKLCDRSFSGVMEEEGQECVILSKVLAWECNVGYQDLGNVEVLKAAGVPVHSLAHLAALLNAHPGPYVRLDLQWNRVVILDVARCRAAAKDILSQNCIPGAGHFPDDLLTAPATLPPSLQSATDAVLHGTSSPAGATSPAVAPPVCRAPSGNALNEGGEGGEPEQQQQQGTNSKQPEPAGVEASSEAAAGEATPQSLTGGRGEVGAALSERVHGGSRL